MKLLVPQIYEEWIITMIKVSELQEVELRERFREKIERLKGKLAFEAGLTILPLNTRLNPMTYEKLNQNLNPENIDMKLDFTQLANIAY